MNSLECIISFISQRFHVHHTYKLGTIPVDRFVILVQYSTIRYHTVQYCILQYRAIVDIWFFSP